ncbi:ATP-binding protein [Aliiruegeria lutimaris]|uniref:histidine kinase n=1 Tax=Aliiruegeria lutimaris TaxID=571298 RepID=A0A1G8S291_9RHOB|nr:ATP-binding protein [Aliiruegeria lutimaris]SDJ23242.1 Signal transduction histidine kinase [Aliiruegeria lutimaris]
MPKIAALDRNLFSTAAHIRVGIGTVGVALLTQDDPQQAIQKTVALTEELHKRTLQELETSGLPEIDAATDTFIEAAQRVSINTKLLFEEAARPRAQRDVERIEPWRQAIYELAEAARGASSVIGAQLHAVDPELGALLSVRELSYAVRDRYARQCSRFRQSVQTDIPLTRQQVWRWRADVGAYSELWNRMDWAAGVLPDSAWITDAVAQGRRETARAQAVMDEVLLGLSNSGRSAYDTVGWFENCVSAYDSILGIGNHSLDLIVDRAEARKRHAALVGAASILALLIAVAFGVSSLRFVRRRLSLPLQSLKATVERLNRGELERPVPVPLRNDEPGAIAAALEALRCRELEGLRLNRQIDDMRDALIEHSGKVNRAKSEFMATMSHEIRTPLNGVLGAVQLLEESQSRGEQRKWLDVLKGSCQLLRELLDDVLDYTRIERRRVSVERIPFSLSERIATVEATVAPSASQKGLEYRCAIDPNVPDQLVGDPRKLGEILFNLLGNAIKFTPEGSVDLHVHRLDRPSEAGQVWVGFTVRDTGIGIDKPEWEALFQPFSQADCSVSRRFGGSGLGLAICKGFLDLLGGEIDIASPGAGRGTTFTFCIPFFLEETSVEAACRETETFTLPRLDVLVAEDNSVNALIVRTMLVRAGHRVEVVTAGFEAVERAGAADFEVVLMDLAMPQLDGTEATRRIRGCAHETRAMVPVVAVTAGGASENQGNPFDGFLAKPYSREDLERTIAMAIGALPRQPEHASVLRTLGALSEQARDLGVEGARKVLELYNSEAPTAYASLLRAGAACDFCGLAEIAHRMKRASRHVGANRISEWFSRLETSANARDTQSVHRIIEDMAENFVTELEAFELRASRELALLDRAP